MTHPYTEKPWPGECSRCGVCCRDFPLPLNPQQVEQLKVHNRYMRDGEWSSTVKEGHLIAPMLVPLRPWKPGWWRFTCRNFRKQLADGLPGCVLGDKRPWMCGAFPYGQPSEFECCTWHRSNKPGEAMDELKEGLKAVSGSCNDACEVVAVATT